MRLGPVHPDARLGRAPRIPLRITLVALLVVLVALALTATGAAATSQLRSYLLAQQDAALAGELQNTEQAPWRVLDACIADDGRYPSDLYAGCLPPGQRTLVVTQGPVDGDADLPRLSGVQQAARTGQMRTVPAADGSTTWRVGTGALPGGYTLVIATDLAQESSTIARLVRLEAVVGLIVLLVMGVAGYLVVRGSLRPLTEVERTAQAIAAGDLSARVPAGDRRTEVGRLSTALNGMLARIETSFRAQQTSEEQARASEARMRRFVADASHELRTPLTSIRGFAELYRQGAVSSPEEVRRLMARIESEGARMGLLVEDLLELARLDQQRPLVVAPVDLAEIASDAVHDAHAVQPGRPVSLRLSDSLTEVPVVLGDEARLRQVVGNLVTNALAHTPPAAAVTIGVAEEPGDPDTLLLEVADEGPGMAPEDAARVFERFYRAESSRDRASGGTGLGLSIVASLVAAHGGRVELRTAPGQGAAFTVRLPRSGPAGPEAGPDDLPALDAPEDDTPLPDVPEVRGDGTGPSGSSSSGSSPSGSSSSGSASSGGMITR